MKDELQVSQLVKEHPASVIVPVRPKILVESVQRSHQEGRDVRNVFGGGGFGGSVGSVKEAVGPVSWGGYSQATSMLGGRRGWWGKDRVGLW